MPILKVGSGQNSAKGARYVQYAADGSIRVEAFASNTRELTPEGAETQFALVRDMYATTSERAGEKSDIQSHIAYIAFHKNDLGDLARPDGSPDWNRVAAYGAQWAARAGIADKHQFYVVAHGDKPHPHIHVVWNATSDIDGKKYHIHGAGPDGLDRLRDVNDQLAREHGIRNELGRKRDPDRAPDGVIRAVERGADPYSWKVDLQNRIKEAAANSHSEESFTRELERHGVDVRAKGGGYSYAFTDDSGDWRAVRARQLGEEYQRSTLLPRFEARTQMLRDPEKRKEAARQMQQDRQILRAWTKEIRDGVADAKRRAITFDGYRDALARKGITVTKDDYGRMRYTFTDSRGIRHEGIDAKVLGPAHADDKLDGRLRENAFRKVVVSAVGGAARKAIDEKEFEARLADKGILLSRNDGRFVYHVPQGGEHRAVEGESLSKYLQTDAVERGFGENRDRREAYGLMVQARNQSSSPSDYVQRLAGIGIRYEPGEGGKGIVEFKGHEYQAAAFGKMDPGLASLASRTSGVGGALMTVAEEIKGVVEETMKKISQASHEGHHAEPKRGGDREQVRRRGDEGWDDDRHRPR